MSAMKKEKPVALKEKLCLQGGATSPAAPG